MWNKPSKKPIKSPCCGKETKPAAGLYRCECGRSFEAPDLSKDQHQEDDEIGIGYTKKKAIRYE